MESSDNPLPSPEPNEVQLKNQCITLLEQNGFTKKEAEFLVDNRFKKLKDLSKLNPDKVAYLIGNKKIYDKNIYIHLANSLMANNNHIISTIIGNRSK